MGIHEVAERLGLSYTSNQEAEWKLAHFLSSKFQEAAKIFIKYNFVEKISPRKIFRECLADAWESHDSSKKRYYVDDSYLSRYFPELCGKHRKIELFNSFSLKVYGETYHNQNGDYSGMSIFVGSIDKSKDIEEFKNHFELLISTIYHECDHIYFRAISDAYPESCEECLEHHIAPSEIRAISKEFAFLFFHAYPGNRFNFKLLKSYIEAKYDLDNNERRMLRYFDLMRNPWRFRSIDSIFQDCLEKRILAGEHEITVHTLKCAFRSYMNHMTYFTQYFNEHPEHRMNLDICT